MRMVVLKVIIGAGLLLVFPAFGLNDAAPFGLSWGPIEKIPRPSLQAREANLTLLIYHKDRLDKFQNTDEIVLEVCKNEGLQQVIWVSRLLSGGEMHERIEQSWKRARVVMVLQISHSATSFRGMTAE